MINRQFRFDVNHSHNTTHTHTYTRNTYMRQQKSLVFAPMSLTTDIFFLHSTFRIFSYGNFSQWGNSDIRSRDQCDSCQVCSSVFVDRRRSQFNGTLTKWVISLHYITWAIDTCEAAKCMRMAQKCSILGFIYRMMMVLFSGIELAAGHQCQCSTASTHSWM